MDAPRSHARCPRPGAACGTRVVGRRAPRQGVRGTAGRRAVPRPGAGRDGKQAVGPGACRLRHGQRGRPPRQRRDDLADTGHDRRWPAPGLGRWAGAGQALRRRPARQSHHADRGGHRGCAGLPHPEDVLARDHVARGHRRHHGGHGARGARSGGDAPGGGARGRLHRLGWQRAPEPGRRHPDPGPTATRLRQRRPTGCQRAVKKDRRGFNPRPDRHASGSDRQGAWRGRGPQLGHAAWTHRRCAWTALGDPSH